MTLEELLRMTVPGQDKGGNDIKITPDFRLAVQTTRAMVSGEPAVHIIIHPIGHNGETLDFAVCGNTLIEIPNTAELMKKTGIELSI